MSWQQRDDVSSDVETRANTPRIYSTYPLKYSLHMQVEVEGWMD
jgi:hypothetical protein